MCDHRFFFLLSFHFPQSTRAFAQIGTSWYPIHTHTCDILDHRILVQFPLAYRQYITGYSNIISSRTLGAKTLTITMIHTATLFIARLILYNLNYSCASWIKEKLWKILRVNIVNHNFAKCIKEKKINKPKWEREVVRWWGNSKKREEIRRQKTRFAKNSLKCFAHSSQSCYTRTFICAHEEWSLSTTPMSFWVTGFFLALRAVSRKCWLLCARFCTGCLEFLIRGIVVIYRTDFFFNFILFWYFTYLYG